jgi:hypothetical protein
MNPIERVINTRSFLNLVVSHPFAHMYRSCSSHLPKKMSSSVEMLNDQAAALTSVAVWASGLTGTAWVSLFNNLRNPNFGEFPYAMVVVAFLGTCSYVWAIVAAFTVRLHTATSMEMSRKVIYASFTALKIGLALSLTTFALFTVYVAQPIMNYDSRVALGVVPGACAILFVISVEMWINAHNIDDIYFGGDTPVNNMTPEELKKVLKDFSDRCTMFTTVAVWAAGLSGSAWVALINTLRTPANNKTALAMAALVYFATLFYVVCISIALLSRIEGNEGELISSKYAKIEIALRMAEWSLKIGLMLTVAGFAVFVQYMSWRFDEFENSVAVAAAPAGLVFVASLVFLHIYVKMHVTAVQVAPVAEPKQDTQSTLAVVR